MKHPKAVYDDFLTFIDLFIPFPLYLYFLIVKNKKIIFDFATVLFL